MFFACLPWKSILLRFICQEHRFANSKQQNSFIMSSPPVTSDSDPEDNSTKDLGNFEYQTSFHAPRLLYAGIIGFKDSQKRQIESEFGVVLTVPSLSERGNSTISIKGEKEEDVEKAKEKIELMIVGLRKKRFPTHFACAPACNEDMKAKFNQVKANILADVYPGIDESLFIEPEKIHITCAYCTLLDDLEKKQAAQIFQECW